MNNKDYYSAFGKSGNLDNYNFFYSKNKLIRYETAKRQLQELNLSIQEYEERLKQLIKELEI